MSDRKNHDVEEFFTQAEEVLKVFSNGKRFAEDLLKENERLRYKLLDLQQQLSRAEHEGGEGGGDVHEENVNLKKELAEIKAHFDSLNRENRDFQSRYEEVEKQNENLLNLYVSGYQMHTTLNEEMVRSVIQEILLNLLGAETFALWVVDQQTGKLEPMLVVDEGGVFAEGAPALSQSLADEMANGRSEVGAPESERRNGAPLVCIPLQLDGKTMGVLAIYRLLQQKEGLTALDQELLGLLTTQAATAIIGSMVVSRALPRLRWLSAGTAMAQKGGEGRGGKS
jgi:hypothetical protein